MSTRTADMSKANNLLKTGLAIIMTTVLTGCTAPGHYNASKTAGTEGFETGQESDHPVTVKVLFSDPQTFNDTDGDGYGEFEGWGSSLCWWANRVGYSDALTEQAVRAFFDPKEGLGLNIGRYNIGGGDNVTSEEVKGRMDKETFLHSEHIQRSDSVIPGYAVDVTRVDLSENTKDYYEENYERVDYDCGFAWNYDWDADRNQVNVLKAAALAAGDEFIAEAFSNSPPYFMTVSGCSSGNANAAKDNLRKDSYRAFAVYLSDVMKHFEDEGEISFESISPMNEPATNYWSAFSPKQEGCHFSPGQSQSDVLVELSKALDEKGIKAVISASDETSINTAISSFNKLSDEAKKVVSRIDTHSYEGDKRQELSLLAIENGKNLWMSEVDGTFEPVAAEKKLFGNGSSEAGDDSEGADAMRSALGFARAIMTDVNGMKPSAWIMWNAADMHIDSDNEFDTLTRAEADRILREGEPFWGIAIADHDAKELLVGKKYYGFGQFTRYIRPGYCILGTAFQDDVTDGADAGRDGNSDNRIGTLAAYDPHDGTVVIVAMNADGEDREILFDLGEYVSVCNGAIGEISAVRTSGDMESGENWADISVSDGGEASEGGENRAGVTATDGIEIYEGGFKAVLKGRSITTYIVR